MPNFVPLARAVRTSEDIPQIAVSTGAARVLWTRSQTDANCDFEERGSGDSNFSHREEDLDLEAGNRETLRRDAERQAALQLERAKLDKS
ncbi:hypothetical protein OSTOST_05864 [Ostertagia ostertagi]